MKATILILAGLISLPSSALQAQTVYKSTGPGGTVVFSDRPPANAKIEQTINFENLPSSPLPGAAAQKLERMPTLAPKPLPRTQSAGVTLYTTSWCGYCRRARAYLAQRGIGYQDIDIETPGGAAAFAQAGGRGGVPLIVANGRRVRGFSVAAYDAIFGDR
jgi:glutaredoxin